MRENPGCVHDPLRSSDSCGECEINQLSLGANLNRKIAKKASELGALKAAKKRLESGLLNARPADLELAMRP